MLEKTVNSFLSELDESKLLDSFCLLDGKKTLSQSTFLATVQAIHGEYSQAKHKLPLVVDIDHESLWEQLNIVNRPMIRSLERSVLRLIKTTTESNDRANEKEKASAQPLRKSDKRRQIAEEEKGVEEENDGIDEDEEIASEEDADDSDSDDDNDGGNEEREDGLSVEEEEEEDMGDGDGSGVGSNGSEEGDMEAWLDEAEAMDEKEERRVAKELQQQQQQRARGGERDEDDEEQEEGQGQSEDDGDLLEGVQHALYDSDSDLDGPETGPGPAAGNYKFDDFFKTEQRLGKPDRTRGKRVAFDDEQELEEDDDDDDDDGDDGEEVELEGSGPGPGRTAAGQQRRDPKKASSKSQRGAAALRAQISGLESFLLQDKPWELRGEVAARDRPQDSLLELAADIERASKPAPVVTQEHTSSLEDLICRRIKDGAFDDVLPPEQQPRGRRDAAADADLSQEKSTRGLGELYAEDFLKKALNSQPEAVDKQLDGSRQQAENLFLLVSRELDALSHFFFTPLPVPRDEPALTSLPVESLQMEDITPVGESRAAAMAPEQVAAKKGGRAAALVAPEELSREDRQRLRRAAKSSAKKDNKKAQAGPDSDSAARLQDQLRADKRVVLAADQGSSSSSKGQGQGDRRRRQGGGGDSLSKSAAFFAQLQRQTQAQIQSKSQQDKKSLKRKAEAQLLPSHSFKL